MLFTRWHILLLCLFAPTFTSTARLEDGDTAGLIPRSESPSITGGNYFDFQWTKFYTWYGFYRYTLNDTTRRKCGKSLRRFLASPEPDTCKDHTSCLLSNVGEINKADMSSATVLLGLTPALLISLAPSVEEIGILSSRRPLLTFLLCLGAPGLSFSRLLQRDSPLNSLNGRPRLRIKYSWLNSIGSTLQYLLALFAMANSVSNAVQLGFSTVISWKCVSNWIPTLWCLISLPVYPLAAVFFVLVKRRMAPWRNAESKASDQRASAWKDKLLYEFQMCGYKKYLFQYKKQEIPLSAMFAAWLATAVGFIHVAVGTLILSSTLFIGTLDALGVILRFLFSSIVCKIIFTVELAGMGASDVSADSRPTKGSRSSNYP